METTYDLISAAWASYPMLKVAYKRTSFYGSSYEVKTELSLRQFVRKFGKSELPDLPPEKVPVTSDAFDLDRL